MQHSMKSEPKLLLLIKTSRVLIHLPYLCILHLLTPSSFCSGMFMVLGEGRLAFHKPIFSVWSPSSLLFYIYCKVAHCEKRLLIIFTAYQKTWWKSHLHTAWHVAKKMMKRTELHAHLMKIFWQLGGRVPKQLSCRVLQLAHKSWGLKDPSQQCQDQHIRKHVIISFSRIITRRNWSLELLCGVF